MSVGSYLGDQRVTSALAILCDGLSEQASQSPIHYPLSCENLSHVLYDSNFMEAKITHILISELFVHEILSVPSISGGY